MMRLVRQVAALDAVLNAIHIDEVGIETGRWNEYFIKSAYRPLYVPSQGMLRAAAVEAVSAPMVDWQQRPLAELLAGAGGERAFVEALCLTLNVRNHANIGDDDLHLVLDCRPGRDSDPGMAAAMIEAVPEHFEHTALRPEMVTCIVADPHDAVSDAAATLARAARRQGMRVGLADFGAGHDAPALLDTIEPDMVWIDPALFRAVGSVPRGRGLLGALVEALHAGDMEVALTGIETPAELDTALASRADLFGGPLLADAKLAGTASDHETIDPRRLRSGGDNVVYLRR
jgi:EAL domain-containing protein (putative c-di-GMP-specific phosphodiesterase class I)